MALLLCSGIATATTGSPLQATPAGPTASGSQLQAEPRFEPYAENPWYWSYDGEPVLPVGSNLIVGAFQYHKGGQFYDYVSEELAPLHEHLGGNWGILRVALHPGGGQDYQPPRVDAPGGGDWESLAAYDKTSGGKYDLDRFNEEYWTRLRGYLAAAKQRNLFAWVDLWDTHVYARIAPGYPDHDNWAASPFRPSNHVESRSGSLPAHAIDFLEALSGPALHYKEAFITKLLDTTADLGTVVYIHDNENELTQAVREHWATFINAYNPNLSFGFSTHRDYGFQRDDDPPNGRPVEEEWIEFFDTGFQYKDPADCSNPRSHAGRVKRAREKVAARSAQAPRKAPVGGTQILAYPWQNLFYGAAAVRFHRLASAHYADCYNPDENWGELLDVIQSLANFVNSVPIHATTPDYDGDFTRGNGGAYGLVDPGELYLVYLEEGGSVEVDLRDSSGDLTTRWFNPRTGDYQDRGTRAGGAWRDFTPPSPRNEEWVLVIQQIEQVGSNHPPEVIIEYPPAGAALQGLIDVVISTSDDGTVAELRLYVDGEQYGSAIQNPNPIEVIRWDATEARYTSGSHQLRAEAIDNEGEVSVSSSSNQLPVEIQTAPPTAFALRQNFPNPFNPFTDIPFDLPRESRVVLRIFDVQGRHVRSLYDGVVAAGQHFVRWHGLDELGRAVASGVYSYELRTENSVSRRRMLLLQ